MINDEAEWFSMPFSPDELRIQYENESLDKYRREHAYYRYWQPRLSESNDPFTEDDISEMLRYISWSATPALIGEIARRKRLSHATTLRLQNLFPNDSWCGQQIAALVIFQDNTLPPHSKIEELLSLGAHEFVQDLLKIFPQERKWLMERLENASLSRKQRKGYSL